MSSGHATSLPARSAPASSSLMGQDRNEYPKICTLPKHSGQFEFPKSRSCGCAFASWQTRFSRPVKIECGHTVVSMILSVHLLIKVVCSPAAIAKTAIFRVTTGQEVRRICARIQSASLWPDFCSYLSFNPSLRFSVIICCGVILNTVKKSLEQSQCGSVRDLSNVQHRVQSS